MRFITGELDTLLVVAAEAELEFLAHLLRMARDEATRMAHGAEPPENRAPDKTTRALAALVKLAARGG